MREKNYGQAIESFDRALALAPYRKDIFAAQIRALLSMGKLDEAIFRCTKALAGSPDMGMTSQRPPLLDKAPEFIMARNNLAFLSAEAEASGKDTDMTLNMAQKAADRFPNDPNIVDTLGWI